MADNRTDQMVPGQRAVDHAAGRGDTAGSAQPMTPEFRRTLDALRAQREAAQDAPRPGDRGFDPGEHRGELRRDFKPGCHDPGGRFEEKERRIADRLAEDGASVHPRERDDSVTNRKNPDAMVRRSPEDPGTVTEFKTLSSGNSGAVRRNIIEAGAQVHPHGGGDVVIDGRDVRLTDEDARRGYARAVGQAREQNLPMPQRVMFVMGDGSIKVFPEE